MTGEYLKNYLEQLGLPRKAFIDYVGVNYRTLTRWLSGEVPIPRMLVIIISSGILKRQAKILKKGIDKAK